MFIDHVAGERSLAPEERNVPRMIRHFAPPELSSSLRSWCYKHLVPSGLQIRTREETALWLRELSRYHTRSVSHELHRLHRPSAHRARWNRACNHGLSAAAVSAAARAEQGWVNVLQFIESLVQPFTL